MGDGINMGLLIAMIEQASGADPAVIEQAVQDWLEDHPEATTTVQDGSITLAKLASDVAAKINQVSQLSDEIDKHDEEITILKNDVYAENKTNVNINEWIAGYVNANGNPTSGDPYYKRSDYINCADAISITAKLSGSTSAMYTTSFYDSEKTFIQEGSYLATDNNNTEYTIPVPNNAAYVMFCGNKAYLENGNSFAQITNKITVNELSNYFKKENGEEQPLVKSSAAPAVGSFIYIAGVPDAKNKIMTFKANTTNFGSIEFGFDGSHYDDSWIAVDNTNVTVYHRNSDTGNPEIVSQSAHGLTIDKYITIIIENTYDHANIILTSISGQHTSENIEFVGCWGALKAKFVSGTFTNAEIKYFPVDITKPVWVFGDSYLSYWPKYCYANGYKNWLADGYPGRNSTNGIRSFNMYAETNTPKIIIWCVGLNDPDTGAINENWKNAVETLINYCTKNSVKLLVSTIPNVPNRDNNYKNEYIKSMGLKCVDVAQAVENNNENTWFPGLLGDDNIHPSDTGAKVIASCFMQSVPEMYGN